MGIDYTESADINDTAFLLPFLWKFTSVDCDRCYSRLRWGMFRITADDGVICKNARNSPRFNSVKSPKTIGWDQDHPDRDPEIQRKSFTASTDSEESCGNLQRIPAFWLTKENCRGFCKNPENPATLATDDPSWIQSTPPSPVLPRTEKKTQNNR